LTKAVHGRCRPRTVLLLSVVVVMMVMTAACTIQTSQDEVTDTIPATTAPPEATTTLPPDQRPPGLADVSVELSELARYEDPLTLVTTRPGSTSVFVATREGAMYEIKRDTRRDPRTGFLSYTARPQTTDVLGLGPQIATEEGADWGLHGIAYSTDGSRLYLSFTNLDSRTVIAELRVSNGRISPTSQRTLLEIDNRDRHHNAGPIAVGADGYLHITLGDGGEDDDPFDNAQDPRTFAGTMLRIDPETGGANPYNVPAGNPWFDTEGDEDGQDEVELLGLRDPQALWYDPITRDGWLLDTGADGMQEVNRLPWGTDSDVPPNLGWPIMNGPDQYQGDEPPEGHVDPVVDYGPDAGCAIVGGVAYHGSSIPGLDGAYLFGDLCTGRILAVKIDDETGEVADYAVLSVTVPENTLSAIGETPEGEPIVVTTTGNVYQLTFVPPPPPPRPPPHKEYLSVVEP
jgi:glucose/arabinose dehydrogenase